MSKPPNNPQAPAKTEAEAQAELTVELEGTFPASDPLSITQPNYASGAPRGKKSTDTGAEAELARQQAAKEK